MKKLTEEENQWSIMFGTIVKQLKDFNHLGFKELAKKANLSNRQLERLLKEMNGNPKLYTIFKLANALGVHPMKLFAFDNTKIYKKPANEFRIKRKIKSKRIPGWIHKFYE